MSNDAIVLLRASRKESRHIHKCNHRNIEGIAKSDETGSFYRCIDVETSRKYLRLVCHESNSLAMNHSESNYNVLSVVGHDFVKLPSIADRSEDQLHIVRLIWITRNNVIKKCLGLLLGCYFLWIQSLWCFL